jgi:hypothetical protein
MEKELNKVTVIYFLSSKNSSDAITIDIDNVSNGAMQLFRKDIENLSIQYNDAHKLFTDEQLLDSHPILEEYSDLLKKLSDKLNEKLNKQN